MINDASEADTLPAFPVSMVVDASQTLGPLKPIWRFFGADEPNYATMPDGKKLLGELGKLSPRNVYFRAHNLLTTGDGTPAFKWGSTNAYTEDAEGKPVYDWKIVDAIFESYLAQAVRPYVQIGFMPEALSIKPSPYKHKWTPPAKYDEIYTGWAFPPKDYQKWGDLAYEWTAHCVQKWGKSEVETWYFQVWNEPNIGYWRGTPEEFHKLHDFAVAGVRRALPNARIGGADAAGGGGKFTQDFLTHTLHEPNHATGKIDPPLDFVSFHAKGQPRFIAPADNVPGHVQMGVSHQLREINDTFALIAEFPEYKSTPIVIGESDPDGCAACQGPQLGYRNTTMYSSYTAASFARKHELAARHGVNLAGALTWAFEFESQPFFAGFRVLATNGALALPVLNVFRLMAKMSGVRVQSKSDHMVALDDIVQKGVRDTPDVGVLASQSEGGDKLFVLLWHYHDDDLPGASAEVTLHLPHLPAAISKRKCRVTGWRVDGQHANSYTAWLAMGSPAAPTKAQVSQLEAASKLAVASDIAPMIPASDGGQVSLSLTLPLQGVVLLVVE